MTLPPGRENAKAFGEYRQVFADTLANAFFVGRTE